MSFIVVDELKTTLSQEINLLYDRVYQIDGISVKILMFNAPSGTFTVSLKDSDDNTLASDTFTSAEIKTALGTSDDYAYCFVPISIYAPLKKASYTLELSASGYTYAENSFIGWIKSYENVYNSISGNPANYTANPFDFLLHERVREDLLR
jgi:hypothetical protein